MLSRLMFILASLASAAAFVPSISKNAFLGRSSSSSLAMGADSEVSFGALDGTGIRVGIIKTRWNSEHVTNLADGIKKSLKACNVTDEGIFETEVPGAYELPYAARLLALSGTVDAIVCAGVLIKGETMHFEYICDAVSSGIMSVGLQTLTPVVFGVLTCLDEEQVVSRSSGDSNHGEDWGKTAVEMALLRSAALGGGKRGMGAMGFGAEVAPVGGEDKKPEKIGFF